MLHRPRPQPGVKAADDVDLGPQIHEDGRQHHKRGQETTSVLEGRKADGLHNGQRRGLHEHGGEERSDQPSDQTTLTAAQQRELKQCTENGDSRRSAFFRTQEVEALALQVVLQPSLRSACGHACEENGW